MNHMEDLFECLLNLCPTPKKCAAKIVTTILERRRAAPHGMQHLGVPDGN